MTLSPPFPKLVPELFAYILDLQHLQQVSSLAVAGLLNLAPTVASVSADQSGARVREADYAG
ncbi:hypothetical protein K458DRAFT_425192 [Lentithecium fluviatile CBS 122367]|uniref:Uncharacterized protein n=1 Tax=Lentithecium fluviatile CBS 122367 TaxID=1168545 RepID=A0A6G1ICE5_9PLEO|nr:hypothetical protein K458DRAFT_425192 [Lentithecium fluviatile CBS 122367]